VFRSARAARKRSRKGTCLDFNLRLATLSEKKHARSTSGKFWYFPERGGHSSSKRFDLHSNGSGKSPSNAQIQSGFHCYDKIIVEIKAIYTGLEYERLLVQKTGTC
jgi:hypothetical protein